ncbi:MAG TPA: CBS domain-containing protein [Burkholderiaceae bacterium]|nr:CBS domain-containing protein [Burkholderiaceae bacterium]
MNVGQISSRNIVRVPRSCRLQEAAALMRDFHVGALIVTDDAPADDHAIGIVTDRDLVLKALAEGIGPQEASLGDVMTEGLATVHEAADVHTAMETMREHGVRRVIVTATDGTLVGVVSLDDVIDALAAQFTSSATTAHDLALASEVETLAGIIWKEREREVEEVGEVAEAAGRA